MEVTPVDATTFQHVRTTLKNFRRLNFRVVSDSMIPLIPVGAIVEVETLRNDPQTFDILVYWDGRALMCHYLHHINWIETADRERIFVTRGLNNPYEDLPIAESKVLGRVLNYRIPIWTKLKILLKRGNP